MATFLENDEIGQRLIALGLMSTTGEWLGGGLGGGGGTYVATDPVAPADGDTWLLVEGVTPDGTVTRKIRSGGVTYAFPVGSF